MPRKKNRYSQIIEAIFHKYFQIGAREIPFERSDMAEAAEKLGIALPKNLGDILYSFRYRTMLPDSILEKASEGYEWVIRPAGKARYKFALTTKAKIAPSEMLVETKILDATPGVIERYVLTDEQGLLAKIRYNRLVDIFTGLTCYSLQNHIRTTVPNIGQIEIDEMYVGIDKRGAHYVLPVEAKGRTDKVGIVQIEQDFAACAAKFPNLTCRSIAAQSLNNEVIAMFEFEQTRDGIAISSEKHYALVRPEELSPEELEAYQKRPL